MADMPADAWRCQGRVSPPRHVEACLPDGRGLLRRFPVGFAIIDRKVRHRSGYRGRVTGTHVHTGTHLQNVSPVPVLFRDLMAPGTQLQVQVAPSGIGDPHGIV